MSKVFEIRSLRKEYGGLPALELSELDVMQGELLSLVGRNGSGKSTLLRMLAFLEEPSFGTLKYFGGADPRREVTLLLQNPYLLRCSVFENVTLGLRLRGDRADLSARYAEAMKAAGFACPEAMASRFSSQLSGGERQRISLASRIIMKPRVLLLDEPTAHVDAASELMILDTVRACLEQDTTVVCATHDRQLFAGFPSVREVELKRV
ncbi:MAG: ATP-binding cassette domain-containing protein [Mailhella sp.]|nr:ATP-binding cassette domain-containing protein [Mailhella sp.]